MSYRIEGFMTIDASDYVHDIEVQTDAAGIIELMDYNNISDNDVLELMSVETGVDMDQILKFMAEDADHSDLYQIAMAAFERIQSDYKNVQQQFDAQRIRQSQTQVALGGTSYVS